MVHIIDDYYVDGKTYDYIVYQKTKASAAKNKNTYRIIGYVKDVASAVQLVLNIYKRNITHEKVMELKDVIEEFNKLNERIIDATKGLV